MKTVIPVLPVSPAPSKTIWNAFRLGKYWCGSPDQSLPPSSLAGLNAAVTSPLHVLEQIVGKGALSELNISQYISAVALDVYDSAFKVGYVSSRIGTARICTIHLVKDTSSSEHEYLLHIAAPADGLAGLGVMPGIWGSSGANGPSTWMESRRIGSWEGLSTRDTFIVVHEGQPALGGVGKIPGVVRRTALEILAQLALEEVANAPPFSHFLTAFEVVHQFAPHNLILTTQCYWFAEILFRALVGETVGSLRRAEHKGTLGSRAPGGFGSLLKLVTDVDVNADFYKHIKGPFLERASWIERQVVDAIAERMRSVEEKRRLAEESELLKRELNQLREQEVRSGLLA
ncbi:hypothetical protein BD414DRAFT_580358 [Trametes punicea]|nr:hypothetical protein BD414DRAFT_580358 [Trametes punicea]